MCLNTLRCSQNAEKLHSESTKFQIFLREYVPKPPSQVGTNHSCKILFPPMYLDCEMGLIRVGGRIHKSSFPDETK